MVKRTLAALFWFYAAWIVWNLVAYAAGWSPLLGPAVAAMVAALVATDPMHRIWTASPSAAHSATLVTESRPRS